MNEWTGNILLEPGTEVVESTSIKTKDSKYNDHSRKKFKIIAKIK